jgi:hypothetical protein
MAAIPPCSAGRHLDGLALDVHRDLQQILGSQGGAGVAGERAADRDRQRRRAGDAGACGGFAAGRQRRVLEAVLTGEQREQRQLVGRVQLRPMLRDGMPVRIDRDELEPSVGARLDARVRPDADRGVHGRRAFVE